LVLVEERQGKNGGGNDLALTQRLWQLAAFLPEIYVRWQRVIHRFKTGKKRWGQPVAPNLGARLGVDHTTQHNGAGHRSMQEHPGTHRREVPVRTARAPRRKPHPNNCLRCDTIFHHVLVSYDHSKIITCKAPQIWQNWAFFETGPAGKLELPNNGP
jgi:hypothetical protein